MVGDVVDRAPSFPDEACDSCMVEPTSHEEVDKEVTCVHGFFILPLGKYLFGRDFRFLRYGLKDFGKDFAFTHVF